MRRFLLLCLLAMAPMAAQADEATDAIAGANFDDIRHGVEALGVSGNPRASAILGAMQDGKLFVRADKTLFIKTDDGSYLDAQTGKPATDVGSVRAIRVNNAIRRSVDAALGALRLFDPD